jgi:hypothetical protein
MRLLLCLMLLMPAVTNAQGYAHGSSASVPAQFSGGVMGGGGATATGAINIPPFATVSATIMNTEQGVFENWDDINNGKIIDNYASVTVKANKPWVLYAKVYNSTGNNDKVVTYRLREKSQQRFIELSDVATPVLYSNNNMIVNNYNFDIELKTSYKTFQPGYQNVNVVFTVSPQ